MTITQQNGVIFGTYINHSGKIEAQGPIAQGLNAPIFTFGQTTMPSMQQPIAQPTKKPDCKPINSSSQCQSGNTLQNQSNILYRRKKASIVNEEHSARFQSCKRSVVTNSDSQPHSLIIAKQGIHTLAQKQGVPKMKGIAHDITKIVQNLDVLMYTKDMKQRRTILESFGVDFDGSSDEFVDLSEDLCQQFFGVHPSQIAINYRDITVANMRKLYGTVFSYIHGFDERNAWQDSPPSDWPKNVRFCDPNNATYDDNGNILKKPKKENLEPMYLWVIKKLMNKTCGGANWCTEEHSANSEYVNVQRLLVMDENSTRNHDRIGTLSVITDNDEICLNGINSYMHDLSKCSNNAEDFMVRKKNNFGKREVSTKILENSCDDKSVDAHEWSCDMLLAANNRESNSTAVIVQAETTAYLQSMECFENFDSNNVTDDDCQLVDSDMKDNG